MSQNLINLASLQFTTNVGLLLQQMDERTQAAFDQGTYVGEGGQAIDQVGSAEANDVEGRLQQIQHSEIGLDSRWVYPGSSYMAHVFDKFDKLKVAAAAGVQGKITMALAAGMKRKRDRIRIKSFFANANYGKQGGSVYTWAQDVTASGSAGQIVGIQVGGGGVDVGLNLDKIKTLIEYMQRNEVGKDEQIFMGLTANDNGKLLREIEVLSGDLKGAINPRVVNGYVESVLGIEFLHSELFSLNDDGSYRQLPAWTKLGVHQGNWQDMKTNISQLNNIVGQPWQTYIDQSLGATRVDPKRVVEVKVTRT